MVGDADTLSCCGPAERCVFAKALLAHRAHCECAGRRAQGEQLHVVCGSPVARMNCDVFAALLHERARFALRLLPAGRPLLHAQALRLQCGGLDALRTLMGDDEADVHRCVARARERHGSLADLPWLTLVADIAAWQPRPRRTAR